MSHVGWSILRLELDWLQATDRELFLGIILQSGEIRIRIADQLDYPSHESWIEKDLIRADDIQGGFSFFVRDGEVTGLIPTSPLNSPPGYRLSQRQIYAILSLLPIANPFSLLE